MLLGLLASLGLLGYGCTEASAPSTTAPPILSTTSTAQDSTTTPLIATTTTVAATDASTTSTVPLDELTLMLSETDSGFASPVLLRADPSGGRDLVVEQIGRIVRADGGDHDVVLDISDDVLFDGEQGLLGLVFHPDFASNGLAYVNYVDRSRRTVIEEFSVSAGVFEQDSRRVILTIDQRAGNHNGGMIEFGPDGYLWIGMGDGGGADDRFGNGQRPDTLLGAMLRIAVGVPGSAYAIPPDNPFADGEGGRREVWAIGLRNPWRFTIDGGTVWIADVGQGDVEEIDMVDATVGGLNYGWPIMEGDGCFRDDGCDTDGLVMPVVVYAHDEGCSITGGRVYRGRAIPEIVGQFFYSDYCSGFIRSYAPETGSIDWTSVTGRLDAVTAFGSGGDGELYVVSHTGSIYRLEAER